ncbi:hypothetical protein BT67DRAFT_431090 [Trichocladium antarcticum]|uniref:CENP-V/GFA domain-containing protein n=1 Tax=Trichocladium antarcticum TaxID=1450529 RepID=A0AAN6ZIA7_9PEZI|nr:hypothetical protein BT67DRAFT_431090 [Trichocladium antarcticum]
MPTLQAQCLCTARTFTAPLPAQLPLPAASCHCTSCRRVTGALRASGTPWPGDGAAIAAAAAAPHSTLRRYRRSGRVTVLFCGECGVGLKGAEGPAGEVPVRCHCGGVDFVLRAGEAQREYAEWQRRGRELPWFVDPVTHKALGLVDSCDTCRVWSGAELFHWTFSALRHVSFAGGDGGGFPQSAVDLGAAVEAGDGGTRDPRFGTLALYASLPDV